MFYNPVNQSRVHVWHAVCRVCHTSKVIKLIPFSTLIYLSKNKCGEEQDNVFPITPQSTKRKAGPYSEQSRESLGCLSGSKNKKYKTTAKIKVSYAKCVVTGQLDG